MEEDISRQALDKVMSYFQEMHHIQPLYLPEIKNIIVNGVELMMLRKQSVHAINEFIETEWQKINSKIKTPPQ